MTLRSKTTRVNLILTDTFHAGYAYDPAGLMLGKTLGNGVEYTAVFDAVLAVSRDNLTCLQLNCIHEFYPIK
jgi:hypothetical protein